VEDVVHYRALEAFCRQRAQMENEGVEFWMIEANRWALKREELFVGPLIKENLPEEAA
jgi:hypothetical protein